MLWLYASRNLSNEEVESLSGYEDHSHNDKNYSTEVSQCYASKANYRKSLHYSVHDSINYNASIALTRPSIFRGYPSLPPMI